MGNCFVPCRTSSTARIVADGVVPKRAKVLKVVKDVIPPLLDSVTEMNSGYYPNTARIKVIITKQQLQELLKQQDSAQEVFSVGSWKPKLQSIPEGSEHVANVATD